MYYCVRLRSCLDARTVCPPFRPHPSRIYVYTQERYPDVLLCMYIHMYLYRILVQLIHYTPYIMKMRFMVIRSQDSTGDDADNED